MSTDLQQGSRWRHIIAWIMLALALAVSTVMGARWVGVWRHLRSGSRRAPDTAFYYHDVMVSTPPEMDMHLRLALLLIVLLLVVFASIPIMIARRGSFRSSLTMTVLMWMAWFCVLILWPIYLNEPLTEPSDPFTIPSPSHSRFVYIQDLWAYVAPWLLGVAIPLQGFIPPLLISVVWVIYLVQAGGWPAGAHQPARPPPGSG